MAARLARLFPHLRRLMSACAAEPAGDAELLGRFIRDRDEDAFAALVARHSPLVPGVCRRLLADAQPAEDAFLRERLKAAEPAAEERLRRLLTELDSEQFGVRQAAYRELADLGSRARPALEKSSAKSALPGDPPASGRAARRLRGGRAGRARPAGDPGGAGTGVHRHSRGAVGARGHGEGRARGPAQVRGEGGAGTTGPACRGFAVNGSKWGFLRLRFRLVGPAARHTILKRKRRAVSQRTDWEGTIHRTGSRSRLLDQTVKSGQRSWSRRARSSTPQRSLA
jgi:hypothetical protein